LKTVSPQATEIYRLIGDGQVLTAQEIAHELNILPNAVYRVTKKLADLGMIEKLGDYPARYRALPIQAAMSYYLMAATSSFRREFNIKKPSQTAKNSGPTISLIKDRPSMLRRGASDARAAKQSIDIIVSGHDVPDETVMAYRKATTIGIPVRMIVHQISQLDSSQTKRWQEIGVVVRYLPDLEVRMIIYDKQIVYITSYDAKSPRSAFGVRFAYEPLALQMSELFEQNWQKAKPL
jgi:sugar-specific transcriptional regulator TrmB